MLIVMVINVSPRNVNGGGFHKEIEKAVVCRGIMVFGPNIFKGSVAGKRNNTRIEMFVCGTVAQNGGPVVRVGAIESKQTEGR